MSCFYNDSFLPTDTHNAKTIVNNWPKEIFEHIGKFDSGFLLAA